MEEYQKALESMAENEPIDQALTIVLSQLGTHLTKLHTALRLLEAVQHKLNVDEQRTIQIAINEIGQMSHIISDLMPDIIVRRLRK